MIAKTILTHQGRAADSSGKSLIRALFFLGIFLTWQESLLMDNYMMVRVISLSNSTLRSVHTSFDQDCENLNADFLSI